MVYIQTMRLIHGHECLRWTTICFCFILFEIQSLLNSIACQPFLNLLNLLAHDPKLTAYFGPHKLCPCLKLPLRKTSQIKFIVKICRIKANHLSGHFNFKMHFNQSGFLVNIYFACLSSCPPKVRNQPESQLFKMSAIPRLINRSRSCLKQRSSRNVPQRYIVQENTPGMNIS